MNQAFVYILSSQKNGTLYIGVTSDLISRIYQLRNNLSEGFTRKYKIHRLVYFESIPSITGAIQREKQHKQWRRQWKIELIEKNNPEWMDLYGTLLQNWIPDKRFVLSGMTLFAGLKTIMANNDPPAIMRI